MCFEGIIIIVVAVVVVVVLAQRKWIILYVAFKSDTCFMSKSFKSTKNSMEICGTALRNIFVKITSCCIYCNFCKLCDQIGLFWKVFLINFLTSLAQILFLKMALLSKNCWGEVLGYFWKNRDTFYSNIWSYCLQVRMKADSASITAAPKSNAYKSS